MFKIETIEYQKSKLAQFIPAQYSVLRYDVLLSGLIWFNIAFFKCYKIYFYIKIFD